MDYSWTQIIVASLASVGGVSGIVTLLVFITARIDKRREAKKAAAAAHLSESADIKRLEMELAHRTDEGIKSELWRLIGEQKAEIQCLKKEIEDSEQHQSLSRPTIQKIYQSARKIRRQVDNLSFLILKEESHDNLSKEVEILLQEVEELEKRLP